MLYGAEVFCPPANERSTVPERPLIVFDVNETLLDLDSMNPIFDRIFNDPAAMRLWFADLILYSEALTIAGVYVPFTDIGAAVLQMLASTRGITISDADGAELTNRFASMPPHHEVPAALRRLRDHGFRLFTLTDNTLEISGRQLAHGGIIEEFERRFSVDETVRRHKPARRRTTRWQPHLTSSGRHLPDREPCLGHDRGPARPAGRPGSSCARATPRSGSARSRTTSARTSTPSPTS